MNFTIFGYIIIFLSILFLFNREKFIIWYVFSSSLFYTTVAYVGNTPIRPFHITTLFMFLFFVRSKILNKDNFSLKSSFYLILFLLCVFISHLFSVFYSGSINVISDDMSFRDFDYLETFKFKISNLSQTIFPLFGVFCFFVIRSFISSLKDVRAIINGYLISFIPLALFIFATQFAVIFGFSDVIYALFSFINPVSDRDVLSDYNSIGEMVRTFTYIGEPSYTVKFLFIVFSILFYSLLFKENTKVSRLLYLSGLLLIIYFIFSIGSTTGFVGLLFLFFLFFILKNKSINFHNSYLYNKNLIFINLGFLLVVILLIPVFAYSIDFLTFYFEYINDTHLSKLDGETGSGVARVNTSYVSFDLFLKSPFFGIGYGNSRSNSYLTFLLSNVGLFGLLFFLSFCFYLIKPLFVKLKFIQSELLFYSILFIFIFIHTIVMYLLFASTVVVSFGWFWINAGVLSSLIKFRSL